MRTLTQNLLLLIALILVSCAKEKDFPVAVDYPILSTQSVIVMDGGIKVDANVLNIGNTPITEYGFSFRATTGSTWVVFDSKKIVGTTTPDATYSAVLTADMEPGKTYNVRAYAIAGKYTAYGEPITFKGVKSQAPVITDFTPKEGLDGTLITITGENFSYSKNLVKVKIGNADAAIVETTSDKIIVKSPPVSYAGSFPIQVTIQDQQVVTSDKYKIVGPYLTHLSSKAAKVGDEITLHGDYLLTPKSGTAPVTVKIHDRICFIKSHTEKEITILVPPLDNSYYNWPASIEVTGWNRRVILYDALTVSTATAFKPASVAPSGVGTLSAHMPSFVVGDKAYLFANDRFISYNIGDNTWLPGTAFAGESRTNSVVAQVGNKAYILGGKSGYTELRDVWEYNITANTWSRKTDLPFTLHSATSFVLNDMIYFFSRHHNSAPSVLWRYNPASQEVVKLNKFPNAVTDVGFSFTIDDKVYVMTGSALSLYVPEQDTWIKKASAPDYGNALTVNNQGYVINASNKRVSKYDAVENRWIDLNIYPGCVTNNTLTAFSYNNRLYAASFACSPNLYYYETP